MSIENVMLKLKRALEVEGLPKEASNLINEVLDDINRTTPSTAISSFGKKVERSEIPFGYLPGRLSLDQGLTALRNTNTLVRESILDAPWKDEVTLEGHVIFESVRAAKILDPNPNDPTHWESKDVIYPMGGKDMDTSTSILVDTITHCKLTSDNKLIFYYEENKGKGTLTLIY